MYYEDFKKSLALVEAAREKNIATEPPYMSAKEKEELLCAFHPDQSGASLLYRSSQAGSLCRWITTGIRH